MDARAEVGTIWTLDPQQIAHHPREMWWDILADARDLAGRNVSRALRHRERGRVVRLRLLVHRRRQHARRAVPGRRQPPAADHRRAGLARHPADRTPVDLLTDAGHDAVAAQLQGTVSGATETRDGIYETARQYASCLLDPDVAAWVTPHKDLPEFRPFAFATSRDTLYLLSKDGGGSASAIIAAAADAVMRAAVIVAERSGGRLDPPALCVLDEAANVCRIADLPDLYSHLGSRGVIPMTILQSYRQGQRCWGEAGMDALWSAATVKIVGSGIDDADFADRLSRQVGDHDVQTTSVSTSERQVHLGEHAHREDPAARRDPRAAQGQGATAGHRHPGRHALHPTLVQGASAKVVGPASARATKAITERALAKAIGHDDFGLSA